MKKKHVRVAFAGTLACSLAFGVPVSWADSSPTSPGSEAAASGSDTAITVPGTEPNEFVDATAGGTDGGDVVTLNLYNLTDVHGHIEKMVDKKKGVVTESGIAAVGCYLDKARNERHEEASFTLLGDNTGATPWTSGALYDDPTIQALNELKPEASTIGNHELDLGVDVFKRRIDGDKMVINGKQIMDKETGAELNFTKVGFPYLGANVSGLDAKYLGDKVIWTSPSGVKVAFIGAIAEDVPFKLSPGATEGLTFHDPISKVNTMAEELKTSGQADVVIAMLDDDVKNNYPKMGKFVDGIMGGDTHVPYHFDMVDGKEGNKLSAIASGSYTDNLANLQVTYDKKNKRVVESKAILIKAEEVAKCGEDPKIAKIVADAKAKADVEGNVVVAEGIAANFLRGVFNDPKDGETPGSNRGIESSLGDLVADAMQDQIVTREGKPVDIGMINAGGLRADLKPGEGGKVTYRQTFNVMPFSNDLGYVTITGAKVKEALEQQWKKDLTSQNSRPMLKLGISKNLTYTYDPSLPFGSRITSVTLNGKPLEMDKTYTVGSVTFLLYGGDSFDALKSGGAPNIIPGYDRDRFNDYLKKNAGVAPRALKSSIGLTLPKAPVADGTMVEIPMRGLSFSEGPSITTKVHVVLGSQKATADVDNDRLEESNKPETAVITTDGAGRAVVKIKAVGECSKNHGNVELPVSVSTDFGEVVKASDGLKVTVACPEAGGAGKADGSKSDSGSDQKAGQQSKVGKAAKTGKAAGGKLAFTGANAVPFGVAALVLLAAGGAMVALRRRRA